MKNDATVLTKSNLLTEDSLKCRKLNQNSILLQPHNPEYITHKLYLQLNPAISQKKNSKKSKSTSSSSQSSSSRSNAQTTKHQDNNHPLGLEEKSQLLPPPPRDYMKQPINRRRSSLYPMLLPTRSLNEPPLYVNRLQFDRILKRREERRLRATANLKRNISHTQTQSYQHLSRHLMATKRQRTAKGQFKKS